ncbi:hypothetical protein IQ238_19765 [Pleurocapsales cyanobacterium LEGE 06147]|nr:hypothetical protein [Pleurocapsales cyanobacterium LEGE 06147]
MMNNRKWSLAVVSIAIASGIITSSSVSARPRYNHDTGGTNIFNSPIFNPGRGRANNPTRRATMDSADKLSKSIQQLLERIAAIEAAKKAAEEGPVRIVRRRSAEDNECIDPREAERELESLLKEAQQLIDEQKKTQPNDGSW